MAKNNQETEQPKPPNARREPFSSDLRVPLPANEIATRADRAAVLEDEIEQKTIEAKETAKQVRAAIGRLAAEKRALQSEVRTKATYREVSCERRFLYDEAIVTEVRLDTNEEISRRAMTDTEKQQFLPFTPDGKSGNDTGTGGDLDDEFGDGAA